MMMTTHAEALKKALEALKIARDQIIDPEYAPIGWSVSRLDEVFSIGKQALAQPAQGPVAQPASEEEMKVYRAIADNYRKDITTPTAAPETDAATVAGLHASISILSHLVDQQRQLLVEVEDVCGRDGHGAPFEDGESELIDKVRAQIAAINPPGENDLFQDSHPLRQCTQPAPVQEPAAIYQYQLANGSWIDQEKDSYDYNVRLGQATVRVVYTTPPAAPVQDDLLVGYFKQDDFRRWVECSPLSSGAQAFYATTPPTAPVQEPVACLSKSQSKAILDLALELEKTGRLVAITEGQERSDFVARNRNIQCALEDALRNATTPPAAPVQELDHSDELTIAYMSGVYRGKELAAPVQVPVNQRAHEMALHQWDHWKQYALGLQERLVKYEGGAPMNTPNREDIIRMARNSSTSLGLAVRDHIATLDSLSPEDVDALIFYAYAEGAAAPVQPTKTGDTLFRQFVSEANKAGITHWPTPRAAQPADQGQSCCCPNCEALSKQLAAQPAVPLTDEQRMELWRTTEFRGNGGQVDWFIEGTRAAEAAHGITKGGAA